jgi:hypothetical protein
VVEDDEPLGLAPPEAEPEALPLAEPEVPGELELGELELELGELELAPPEAEPDLVLSLEADPLMPEDELEEGLDGLVELDEAPPEGDEEGELLGEDVLELGELDVLLELSPRSHAARPRASATATAIAESFMCPPWLGCKEAANCAPGLNP